MLRSILISLAVIVGLIVASWIVLHIIGLIWIMLSIAVTLAVVAGIGYILYTAFLKNKEEPAPVVSYKVFDTNGPQVRVYRAEPSLQDLVSTDASPDKQEFSIANDTPVLILEDKGQEAIKIKILNKKAQEKVGWVARSSVVRESKDKTG